MDAQGDAEPIFGAVLHKKKSHWRWWVALSLELAVASVALASRNGGGYRVMTAKGFKVLKPGMSTVDVGEALGGAFAEERDADGADCLIYGHPTVKMPEFTVYAACYRDGRLVRVTSKDLSATTVDPDALRKLVEPPPP
ncbi:MAG TPA: hypothetical protein VH208_00205 [Myxococcaceae bacterium]|nr:hypothetical protein [Myxococcaceae bacterium]